MRTDKNLMVVLNELKDKGLTRDQIASKMGIKTRTLVSYYDYFRGDKDNRHSRPVKDKRIKDLKKLAQSKGIRTTYTIQDDPQTDQIIYISVYYTVYFKDSEGGEKRFMILTDSQQNFAEQPDKDKYIHQQVSQKYREKPYDIIKIEINFYTVKTETEFTKIKQ